MSSHYFSSWLNWCLIFSQLHSLWHLVLQFSHFHPIPNGQGVKSTNVTMSQWLWGRDASFFSAKKNVTIYLLSRGFLAAGRASHSARSWTNKQKNRCEAPPVCEVHSLHPCVFPIVTFFFYVVLMNDSTSLSLSVVLELGQKTHKQTHTKEKTTTHSLFSWVFLHICFEVTFKKCLRVEK